MSKQRVHQLLNKVFNQLQQAETHFLPLLEQVIHKILEKYAGIITSENFQKEWNALAPNPALGLGILHLMKEYFRRKAVNLLEKVENGFYTGAGKEYKTVKSDGRRALQAIEEIFQLKGALTEEQFWIELSRKMPRKPVKEKFQPLVKQLIRENYIQHTPTGYLVISRKARTYVGKLYIALSFMGRPAKVSEILETCVLLFGRSADFSCARLRPLLTRSSSKFIWTGKRAEYALAHWGIPRARGYRIARKDKLELVAQALKQLGKPANPREILDFIRLQSKPPYPINFNRVYSTLLSQSDVFTRGPGKGEFSLKDWNLPAYRQPKLLIKEILTQARNPLSASEILMKIRQKYPEIRLKNLSSYLCQDKDFAANQERKWFLTQPEVYKGTPYYSQIQKWQEFYEEKKEQFVFKRYIRKLLSGTARKHIPASAVRRGLERLMKQEDFALIVKVAPHLPKHRAIQTIVRKAKKRLLF